jgi:amidohydrolase
MDNKANFNLEQVKVAIKQSVEAQRPELEELSLKIHSNPELAMEEVKASGWLCDYLENHGFKVERGFCQLPTAFRAIYGKGKPVIAFLAEYDALPGLGHGCGHNIIATSLVGAGVAGKVAVDHFGGCIQVIGTPAEEGMGGKILLAQRGAFKNVDSTMLVHPGTRDTALMQSLGCSILDVEFWGKSAHAASRPEQGINALEAMIMAFNAINSLRQHIKDRCRIHGIITDGGQAANIVPAHCAGNFMVRAPDDVYLEELKGRVLDCFKGAALASGARLEYRWSDMTYAPIRANLTLAEMFTRNMESLGRRMEPYDPLKSMGSTDMGNVSQLIPAIHPSIAIAPTSVCNHSPEFAVAAASEEGHKALVTAAAAMGMTAAELLGQPELLAKVKKEFLQPI